MQLRGICGRRSCTRLGLAAATLALLGSGDAEAADRAPVAVETAVLGYSEPSRVQVLEGVISARSEIREGRVLHGRLVFDVLTGASANGAVPSRSVQTFTRPSGESRYQVAPGDTPLDDGFSDRRFAADLGYDLPLDRCTQLSVGAQGSVETDYLSLGIHASLSRDFFERNTTLGLGVSVNRDRVSPLGGIPTPFAPLPTTTRPRSEDDEGGGLNKTVIDLSAGITQVLGRNTLLRVNYAFDHASGYMTDPYNVISVVAAPSSVAPGTVSDTLHESRPDSRTQHAIYTELKRALGANVADLSYRYAANDWGVHSQTVELRYRQYFGPTFYLQPHGRYYHQTAAGFYSRFLIDASPLPQNASADYRLAEMETSTAGLEVGHELSNGRWMSFAVEYYRQFGIGGPQAAFGALEGLDLYPEVSALTARVGFSGEW